MNLTNYIKHDELFGKYLTSVNKQEINYSALELENVIITNPDEDELEWIIKDSNKHYIVPYLIDRKSVNDNKYNNVSTQYAFEIDIDSYVVTGNKKHINELQYMKYIKDTLSHGTQVNIAHPNETFTDLFLI